MMTRLLLVLLLVFCLPLLASGSGEKPSKIGESLEFSLPDLTGKEVKLSSFRGKVVLVDFWASYCKPCRKELPFLDKLLQKYEKKGLAVIGISVDPEKEMAQQFLEKHPVRFPSLLDTEDSLRQSLGAWELPLLYVIDREGKIRAIYRGIVEEGDEGFVKELEALLAEKK